MAVPPAGGGRSMAKTRRVEEGRSHSFHARVGPRPARLDAARSVFSCHSVRFFEGFAALATFFFSFLFFVKYTRRRGGLLGGRAVSARSLLPPKHPRRRTYGSKGRRKTNCKLFFFLFFFCEVHPVARGAFGWPRRERAIPLAPKHPRRRTYGSKGRRETNCKLFFFLFFCEVHPAARGAFGWPRRERAIPLAP